MSNSKQIVVGHVPTYEALKILDKLLEESGVKTFECGAEGNTTGGYVIGAVPELADKVQRLVVRSGGTVRSD